MRTLEFDGGNYDEGDAVFLVGCGKAKQEDLIHHYAKDLYTSTFFRHKATVAEAYGHAWYILSAKHELLHPYSPVLSYDLAVDDLSETELETWADRVSASLRARSEEWLEAGVEGIVVFASAAYLDPLRETLEDLPFRVETPLQGRGLYDQMSYLSDLQPPENETLAEFKK